MATRRTVTVTLKDQEYVGEYELKDGLLRVFFDGKYKETGHKGVEPVLMAKLLLIDLVSGL
jgi:hypothetical protein